MAASTEKPLITYTLPGSVPVVLQLAEVINQANSSDSRIMRPVLAAMVDYPALAGPYNMNEVGDAVRSLQPIIIENQRFVNVSGRF